MKDEIIVIEDNDTVRLGIFESLSRENFLVHSFESGPPALKFFASSIIPFAIVDLKMEPLDGISILKKMKEINPKVEVLMISAFGTVETAVRAMQYGAADFLTKPFSSEELRERVKKIFEKIKSRQRIEELLDQNYLLQSELDKGYDDIIGNSEKMKNIFQLIEKISAKDSTVLIQGESGTGKELAAHAIHKRSKRAEFPFIKVNCGALNENLLESELFGHEKGAFTGAIKLKKGRFELANKGSLFLDEIGDISQTMQVKLLRVLQDGEFERVGGEITIKTDVRIITATNQDLQKLISDGKFREDLYYRLSVIPIDLPPLRERKEDIPLLVNHFLQKFAGRIDEPAKTITSDGMKLLLNHSWGGNIRELENLIERLCVISHSPEIESELIARHISNGHKISNSFDKLPLDDAVSSFEKNMIIHAMKKAEGIKNRAAKILGISTSVLYYKLEKYGLIK